MRIDKGGGFTLIELLVTVAIIGVLASILTPVLAKSRNKANRKIDLNNLKQQHNAYTQFSNDQDGRYPWLMDERKGAAVVRILSPGAEEPVPGKTIVKGQWEWLLDIERLHQTQAVVENLKTAKVLLSPCDPGAKLRNQKESSPDRNFFGWEEPLGKFTTEGKANHGWGDKAIDQGAQSYSVCFGADPLKGEKGIMLLTRNHGGAWASGTKYNYFGTDLEYGGATAQRKSMVNLENASGWLDIENMGGGLARDRMAGLATNEGQMVFCDGHAIMANDADFQEAIKEHKKTGAGLLKTPNFNTARPDHKRPPQTP